MNTHVREFYGLDNKLVETPFQDVIFLSGDKSLNFEQITSKCPNFPKGYFELCHLNLKDRIEFVASFWEKTLTYVPHVHDFYKEFFSRLEDIGVILVKKDVDIHYECHFIYSVDDDHTFYKGKPSINNEQLETLKAEFEEILPEDYLDFLKIHDGFAKDGDLGLIHSSDLLRERRLLQTKLASLPQKALFQGSQLLPDMLIPFYKSFGLDIYQCFVKGWYPDKGMGNTLFSLSEGYLSDYNDLMSSAKNLAFPTFLDWLMFYMEVIDV